MAKKKAVEVSIVFKKGNILVWRIEETYPEIHCVLDTYPNSGMVTTVDDLGNITSFDPPRQYLTVIDPSTEKHPIVDMFIRRSLESVREQSKGITKMVEAIEIINNIR